MSAPPRLLAEGLAAWLADRGVGTYRPDGSAYQPDEVGIVIGDLPITPDRVIGLRAYHISGTGTADGVDAVQVRFRGARNHSTDVDDLAELVANFLDYAEPGRLGDVPTALVWRQIAAAPLGTDNNGRSGRADTYYLHTSWMTPGRHT